jgi:hypothetical protein
LNKKLASFKNISYLCGKNSKVMITTEKRVSAKKYYGIWGDDGMTDDEFVDELKSLRSFNRDIIEHI